MTLYEVTSVSTVCVAVAALALAAGCSGIVAPGDPLVGTWRSDEYAAAYPAPPSTASTVDEDSFAADGSMSTVTTRQYPVSPGDPYSGCTWIDRHTGWRWMREDAGANLFYFGPTSGGGAQLSVERTGCTDPAQNHPPHTYDDPTFPLLGDVEYSIEGNRLALTFRVVGPGGVPPMAQMFTRVQ